MTPSLARIRRHPIKSIGGEDLDQITLQPDSRMSGDREFAVLTQAGERHAGTGQPDRWLPKTCFLRGVAAPGLQAIKGGWDGEHLHLSHPDRPDLRVLPDQRDDALTAWLAPLWPDDLSPPTRLVRGAGVWTDVKTPWISILSLTSLQLLEQRLDQPLGIERWRGNLWLEGLEPLAELDLMGKTIRIGDVALRVLEPIGRCAATSANTDTGQRDLDMVKSLGDLFGHTDFGVYAEVTSGGRIAVGDEVTT